MGMTADERLQPLELDPEMASLTTGTANFGDDVFFNDTALMTEFYQRMQKKGVRPEFEIFEAGQIDNALKLVKQFGPAGPLTALGLRARRARQHERRAAQPRVPGRPHPGRARPGRAPASAAGTCRSP